MVLTGCEILYHPAMPRADQLLNCKYNFSINMGSLGPCGAIDTAGTQCMAILPGYPGT